MNFIATAITAPPTESDYLTLFNPIPQGDYVSGNVYESRGTSEPDILKAVTLIERGVDTKVDGATTNAFLRGI
ncbi:hypothetical protein [Burkholderia gladioli]|uniref:hypothetical protein n=1 Tax=Burkholderia gladioli TaxID=28095 RepID=UPI0013F626AD|nr:hypothetical protein [Burkholderia gladioli]NHH80717.1 hypothetical protein [Burkholderia gladioli]